MYFPKSLKLNVSIAVLLWVGFLFITVAAGTGAFAHSNAKAFANSDYMGQSSEKVFLEGAIGINDTSTGCWFLRTDKGLFFEVIFCVSEPLELKPGLRVRVYGYVEPDAPQTCSFGPVFYAE